MAARKIEISPPPKKIPPMYARGYNGVQEKAVLLRFERVMRRRAFETPADGAVSW
jgi:hypothetical protein